MIWALFAYVALPPGALLACMLASGSPVAMSVASKVLSTPVRIGSFQLSLATFMSAICAVGAAVSYSGMRRSEARVDELKGSPLAQVNTFRDQQERNSFHWGRNFYLTLLGLTLWLGAWRLKALYGTQQLTPVKAGGRPVSRVARLFYFAMGVAAFLAADIPMCRINYNLQLLANVTPRKAALQPQAAKCDSMFLESAVGPCKEFCDEVFNLSQERLATIKYARDWHVLGRLAAQFFDDARGVEQGGSRIQELFRKKSCAQVLKSVDKSNDFVNGICVVCAIVSLMGAFSAMASAYEGSWYGQWNGADWYDMTHTDPQDKKDD